MESNKEKDLTIIKKVSSSTKGASVWTYIWVSIRSYFLQNSFNYADYQGVGYANVIYPGLVKIYGKGTQKFKNALIQNIEFFNSNPQTLPLITSVQLKMLEAGQSFADVRSVKMALMGPLSGIGDSMSQYGWYPLFAAIGVGMAQEGQVFGPIFFLLAINIVNLLVKITLGYFGFKLGQNFVTSFSSKMQVIIRVATIVGIIVIAALAIKFTKFSFALKYETTITTINKAKETISDTKTVTVQSFIDNIIPFIMPALWVSFVFVAIKKYNWTVYRVILFTLVFGLTMGTFGILG